MYAVIVVVCALLAFGEQVLYRPVVAAGDQPDRAADLVAIEKLRQQDIAATVARDPVALTDFWTMTPFVLASARRRKSARRPSERATNVRRPTRISRC